MNWKFEVGQQVVCISDDWCFNPAATRWPKKGDVLTVRDIDIILCNLTKKDILALRFVEIVNPVLNFGSYGIMETWYHSGAFRPVRKTSIECFKKMLAPIKNKELQLT